MALRKYKKFGTQAMLILDLLVIYGAFQVALISTSVGNETRTFIALFWVTLPMWGLFLKTDGMYTDFHKKDIFRVLWLIIKTGILTFLFLAAICFIVPMPHLNKYLVKQFIGSGIILLGIEKCLLILMMKYSLSKAGYNRNILLVGTGPRAEVFVNTNLRKNVNFGINIMGLIDEEPERVGKEFFGIKCIGTLNDVASILDSQSVDEVVIVVPRMWLNRIQETISLCELRGVKVSVAGDLFELKLTQPGQKESMDDFPLLTFVSKVDHDWELFLKRVLDIAATFCGLLVLSVPFMIIALLVKFTSNGPIFFRQKRVGLHGRLFNMHKFRTMYTDARERFEKIQHLNQMDGPVFKIKNDPRITPIGRILRKFSLDELPQIWDVLVGNMSLVGPRPGLASELEKFEPWMTRRLTMRPGITCLWQISGRNNIDFKTWMELDLKYIDNWSFGLDITILLKTLPAVARAEGAS